MVVPKGRRSPRRRWGLRSRSMVAALISSTCLLTAASRTSLPCRSKALANSAKKGCSLLPHIRSPASQTALKPLTASGPYFLGREEPVLARRRTWASPQGADQGLAVTPPVTCAASSRSLPFSFRSALAYLSLIASKYSITLPRVTPPSGNTACEATIPSSVTFIMSQFANFTFLTQDTNLKVEVDPVSWTELWRS